MTLGAPRTGRIAVALILGDALAVYGAFWLAFLIRFNGRIPAFNWIPFQDAAPWLVIASLILLYAVGLYHEAPVPAREEMVSAWVASGIYLLLGMGISYAGATYAIPRSVFLLQAPLQAILVLLVHGAINQVVLRWAGPIPLVVVGDRDRARRAAERLQEASGRRWDVTVLEVGREEADAAWPELEGRLPAGPFWLYLDDALPWRLRFKVAVESLERQATLLVAPRDVELLFFGSSPFTYVGDLPLVVVRPLRPPADVRAIKRAGDLLSALVLGLLSAPFWIVAALLVRLSSPGPILYRQLRVGLDGRSFVLFKFRTMIDGAEDETGAVMATDDDPRITPVGRWLRAIRLDELPQLLNVLRGDMSLVGPRPERPEFVQAYEAEYPLYPLRHKVKPGITGLAQVIGTYSTDVEDKLRCDLLYVHNHSLVMDLQILLWTLKVVLLPERARGVRKGRVRSDQVTAREIAAATVSDDGRGPEPHGMNDAERPTASVHGIVGPGAKHR